MAVIVLLYHYQLSNSNRRSHRSLMVVEALCYIIVVIVQCIVIHTIVDHITANTKMLHQEAELKIQSHYKQNKDLFIF